MQKYRILTNNPMVRDKYPDIVDFFDVDAEGVLIRVRDLVHLGAGILNHPLSGDVLPGVCPYKSIIVSERDGIGSFSTDHRALSLIESAIGALVRPPDGFKGYDEAVLDDFRVLDLDLLDSAIGTLI